MTLVPGSLASFVADESNKTGVLSQVFESEAASETLEAEPNRILQSPELAPAADDVRVVGTTEADGCALPRVAQPSASPMRGILIGFALGLLLWTPFVYVFLQEVLR